MLDRRKSEGGIDWLVDWRDDIAWAEDDRLFEFVFWWEDMRPKEVLDLIMQVYDAGVRAGRASK